MKTADLVGPLDADWSPPTSLGKECRGLIAKSTSADLWPSNLTATEASPEVRINEMVSDHEKEISGPPERDARMQDPPDKQEPPPEKEPPPPAEKPLPPRDPEPPIPQPAPAEPPEADPPGRMPPPVHSSVAGRGTPAQFHEPCLVPFRLWDAERARPPAWGDRNGRPIRRAHAWR